MYVDRMLVCLCMGVGAAGSAAAASQVCCLLAILQAVKDLHMWVGRGKLRGGSCLSVDCALYVGLFVYQASQASSTLQLLPYCHLAAFAGHSPGLLM
jgi:hypothetical protein